MDREMILRHLKAAERHVADSDARIARQKLLIANLERDGLDTAQAGSLLETFEDTQRLHEQHLQMIRAELAAVPRSASLLLFRRRTEANECRHRGAGPDISVLSSAMPKAVEYRLSAIAAEEEAERVREPNAKATFLDVARQWRYLADRAERDLFGPRRTVKEHASHQPGT